ncbi:COX15/CtaA family protein [Micromonospora sp. WMMA1363]|uniref:COX15/CtaA family protein n=1 Tax=Micromonospora sp. WMMA1363 TaxID=3053985 RepID=UPI00259CF2F6|nr:COX15/CtaA family protein [Micromonospora sp. WMMA1363]MDM4719855.1 COX15/CtaA family protein [Micromonospora sp. WMMA1363]
MRRICAVTPAVRFPVSTSLLRRLAFANIVANVAIVVTGGAVRLTASGLGCPTWPRCTDESYTTTPEMGVHGMIEYGNRLLTFVLVLIAGAALLAALLHRPRRRSVTLLAASVVLGILAQAVIGGITVRTQLHPSIVGIHFVVSMLLLLVSYALWRRIGEPDSPARLLVPVPLRTLVRITSAASAAVIVAGVAVTGSGPHAGDADAVRNGLDPESISQVHADLVFLLVGLSLALWLALRAVGAPAAARRAAGLLLAAELAQGVVGFVQYVTNLPAVLVGAHMLGSCLVWLATLSMLWSIRDRHPATSPVHAPPNPTRTADVAPAAI